MTRVLTYYIAAMAAIMLLILAVAPAGASDLPSIAASTYKLYEGDRGICSVTFLKNDKDGALFLTAAHCVDGGDRLNVREQTLDQKDLKTVLSENISYVKAVRTLKQKDIAIIQTMDKGSTFTAPGVDIATPTEANGALKFGDKLIVVGYPAAEALSVTEGTFAGKVAQVFSELDKETPMYQTTVPVAGGNSGGGLYARIGDTWKLIGTVTGKRTDNDVMTWMQTAETVDTALKGYMSTGTFEPKPERPSQMGIDQR